MYYEKIRLAADKEDAVLTFEIGKIERKQLESHEKTWESALNMIKELAEKKIT